LITLRFVTCNDPVSNTIRRGEMGFWASHVEAVMPDGKLLGAHAAGGVQECASDYDAGLWTQQLYVQIPCTDAEALAFETFLKSQLGKPYDMPAIEEMALGILTGEAPNWPQKPSWICSALQTAALLMAGIIKGAPATVRLATPRDVLVAVAALVEIGTPETRSGMDGKLFTSVAAP
jgi:hypothetical protein